MSQLDAPVLVASGVGKSLGGRRVLAGLDFTLARGAMLGLVGANGGGKTTTLRILAGLIRPDEGTIRLFGDDLRESDMRRRRCVGYMSQGLSLYPDLTVRENLRFRAAFHSGSPMAMIEEAAERCGLVDRLATRIDQLSGGWARRAQFAALLVGRPPLLLLDEPTAGLDLITRRTMWRWMAELAAEGHVIVVSTHDLVEAGQCPAILHFGEGGVTGPMSAAAFAGALRAGALEEAVAMLAGRIGA